MHLAEATLRAYRHVAPTGRGMFRLARMVRSLRPRDRWRDTFTVDGHRLDLDLGVYPDCCMAFGVYELDTARLIRRLLKPGDHFVDGGANLGYFTLMAARRVGPAGRVDAFEPVPATRRRLTDHVTRNGLDATVRVHPEALSDTPGEATIHVPHAANRNHGESSLFAPADADHPAEAVAVQTVRLGHALQGTSPTLVKLDLEGAEAMALRGASGLLQVEQPPALIVEFDARHQRAAGEPVDAVWHAVHDANPRYRCDVIGSRLRPIADPQRDLARLGQINLLFRAGAPSVEQS